MMEEKRKKAISASIDVFVALMLVIIGFLLLLYGKDWLNITEQMNYGSYSTSYNSMYNKIPWIIIFSAITTIIYGIKKLVGNLTKIFGK